MSPSPGLPLDCAPLAPVVDVSVSSADLSRIEPLQRELLRPLEHDSVDAWRSAVNRALKEAMGGDSAMFQLDLPGCAPHHSDELSSAVLTDYVEIMPDLERTRDVFTRAPELGAGNRFTLWYHHLEWLYDSPYYHEVIAPLRAFDTLWAAATPAGGRFPAMLHVYHDRPDPPSHFDAVDVQLMRLVRPALEAGVRAVVQLHERRTTLGDCLDRLSDGIFAFGVDGELLHRNERAGRMVSAPGGAALAEAAARLARSVAGPRRTGAGPLAGATVRTAGGRCTLGVSHLVAGMLGPRPAIVVTVTEEPDRVPSPETIQARFDLTERESEVAVLLAAGRSNAEVADALVISPHTARRHTERVLRKLGVRKRAEVTARVLT